MECKQCKTIIQKYKHYKKKYESERNAVASLESIILDKNDRILILERSLAHAKNEQIFSSEYIDSNSNILSREFKNLEREVEGLLGRNEQLEDILGDLSARSNKLAHTLGSAKDKKANLQSVLLSSMKLYESSLRDGILEQSHKSDMDLLQELFKVQDSIENTLFSEVLYLRELGVFIYASPEIFSALKMKWYEIGDLPV